jgi:aspartyl-tRNA synthetase
MLKGWVANHRDHGGVIFLNLRDRWGITQVVFRPTGEKAVYEIAKTLKLESVIGVSGKVHPRPDGMVNSRMPTGEIEVEGEELVVYNEARPLPFLIKDPPEATDELRLKYRYLDLRRPHVQKNILLRHRVAQIVRHYFDKQGFVEIETPCLMKSTPEGARDFLVPSRIHKGRFYALPQSPQTYKQLLMVSGYDRYFQIVRCFRDEDLRADRQPEFTQIDVEMSFVREEDVMAVMEGFMRELFETLKMPGLPEPFPRMAYSEAMARFGTDCPDLRFGMEIRDVSKLVAESEFRVFRETVAGGGSVRGICLENAGPLSRKTVDVYTEFVRPFGARGLISIQKRGKEIVSPVAKFLSEDEIQRLLEVWDAHEGDTVFIVAGEAGVCAESLGQLRRRLAADFDLIKENAFKPLWVVDFPLLEWNEEENRYLATHHPFTAPLEEDLPLLSSSPEKVRARAYDLVLNGSEIAGGSIRNHRRSVQEKMFKALGFDPRVARDKFGFLIDALDYGAPPHGGIAFGYDRMVMLLAGENSIREVIAFPKTTSALSLMDGSPAPVDETQLKELGLKIDRSPSKS